jgi:hypothetical protein
MTEIWAFSLQVNFEEENKSKVFLISKGRGEHEKQASQDLEGLSLRGLI